MDLFNLKKGTKMKNSLSTICLIFLLIASLRAAEPIQYQASSLFSKKDVRTLVDKYYTLHDRRAKANAYYPLLADNGLYMLMGSVVNSKKEFRSWLRKVKIFSMSVKHTVKNIDISVSDNGSYYVDLCVRYRGRTRIITKYDKTDRIKWEMVESKDELRLVVKTYVVEDGCK
jgi:hypothetical protein